MKLKYLGLISLILLIFLIPVSFAAETDTNGVDYSTDCENVLELSSNPVGELNGNLEDETIISDSNESVDNQDSDSNEPKKSYYESAEYELENLGEVSSNMVFSEDGVRLADLDSSFAIFSTRLTSSNTIYVDVSSTHEGYGSQSSPFNSLSTAINNVTPLKNNIFLAKGVYTLSNLTVITKSMNIIGEGTDVILDGNGGTDLFVIVGSSVTVNFININFVNAFASKNGAALFVYNSSVNFINCSFENNTLWANDSNSFYGGVIYNLRGFLKLYNTIFKNNKIISNGSDRYEGFGGAIYSNCGELTIINSKFLGNYIDLYNNYTYSYGVGGAIYCKDSYLSIFNSSLENNYIHADYSLGAAVSIWGSANTYIINSTLNGNYFYGDKGGFGSAVTNRGPLLEIVNSTVSNNRAYMSFENTTIYNINGVFNSINNIMKNNTVKTLLNTTLFCIDEQLTVFDAFNDNDYHQILNELGLSSLPSNYDLRDYNLVTTIRDQGESGACWTFAMLAAMESYLLKYDNVSYDFSENNMKNTMNIYSYTGSDLSTEGNYLLALAYLLRWSGAINETDDPYSANSTSSPPDLTPVKYLSDVLYVPLRQGYLDNDQIKLAILKYGAVFASMYADDINDTDGVYDKGYKNAYFNIRTDTNHAVAIVGWDDSYSRNNFRITPPGDGAFIVRNSWGPYIGTDGYFYLSYYDASFASSVDFCSAVAVTNVIDTDEYLDNYQYDSLGNTYLSLGYNSNTIWFANRFTAVNDNPIGAFGLYTYGDSSYVINIFVNDTLVHVSNGTVKGAGYHTVRLNSLVPINEGDVFNLTVKLTTPDSLFPLAIEVQYPNYSSKATSEVNQSSVSPNGKDWYDLKKDSINVYKLYGNMEGLNLSSLNPNVCLKAYTYKEATHFNEISFKTIKTGDNLDFTLYDEDNNPLSGKEITVSVNNNIYPYTIKTNESGSIMLEFDLDQGVYYISLKFDGDEEYKASTLDFTLKIFDGEVSDILITSSGIMENGSALIHIYLLSGDSIADIDDYMIVHIYNNYLDESKNIPFTSGKVSIILGDAEDDFIIVQAKYADLDVLKVITSQPTAEVPLTVNGTVTIAKSENDIIATLRDSDGNLIQNAALSVNVSGKIYSYLTNNIGQIYIPIDGNMTVTVTYTDKNGLNTSATFVNNVINNTMVVPVYMVANSSIVLALDGGNAVKARLTDLDGNPIPNAMLNISINGASSQIRTDSNGYARFAVKANSTIIVSYTGSNGLTTTASMNYIVNNTVTEVPVSVNGSISFEKNGNTLSVILKDSNGNPINGGGLNVNINGRDSKYTTGNNGKISFNLDYNATVTVSYTDKNGLNTSSTYVNTVIVNTTTVYVPVVHNRTASKISYSNMIMTAVAKADGVGGPDFKIRLLDRNGKPISGRFISIGFNSQVQIVETDGNGYAKIQLNIYSSGTFMIAMAFLGDDNYTGSFEVAKIVVNKQTPKIVASKKTFKVKAKTKKITATFKTAKGKPVSGKRISFVVKGKTYTATTNSKGVATVKISLTRKGTYTCVAKYAGDSTFKATSTKFIVKLT